MHGSIQFTNKNLIVFNYIFPTIDLNFNNAGSQFIKSQPSLKLINIIKQMALVKGGYYLQTQQLLILFFFSFFSSSRFKADAIFECK